MANSNLNNTLMVLVPLGSIAAAGSVPAFKAPRNGYIKSVSIMNGADIAASDTDYAQVSLVNGLAGTVMAEIDTRAAHENGLLDFEGKALNVVAAASEFEEGDNIVATYAEGGTMALTNAVLAIELRLE
jgi:hypothetical protein